MLQSMGLQRVGHGLATEQQQQQQQRMDSRILPFYGKEVNGEGVFEVQKWQLLLIHESEK